MTLSAASIFGAPAIAAELPESGTIKIHSNLKGNTQAVQVAEKHFMGSGNGSGVSYNDAGSGPLHMGAWMCTYTFDDVNGSFNDGGWCAFGDAGGADKIFIVWSGKGTDNAGEQGTGTIIGGIGKYSGISGKMAYQCKWVDQSQVINTCTQQFDYQLASEAKK